MKISTYLTDSEKSLVNQLNDQLGVKEVRYGALGKTVVFNSGRLETISSSRNVFGAAQLSCDSHNRITA